jgi:hypothetical protein
LPDSPRPDTPVRSRPNKDTFSDSFTFVFDIDEVTCRRSDESDTYWHSLHEKLFPWAKRIDVTITQYGIENGVYPHYFDPFIHIVFKYLKNHGYGIAFFSAGVMERNRPLIRDYFETPVDAPDPYPIFSKHQTRKGGEWEGNRVKDLVQVGFVLEDTLLIDDDKSYIAHDQHPRIPFKYKTLEHWLNELCNLTKAQDHADLFAEEYLFVVNQSLYLLGLIDLTLSRAKAENISLRESYIEIMHPYRNDLKFYDGEFLENCSDRFRHFLQSTMNHGELIAQYIDPTIKALDLKLLKALLAA